MMVCLDTNILIWGVREEATRGQEGMIASTKRFLERLSRNQSRVIIPAPVVAEYLIGISEERQPLALEQLRKYFMIVPFDAVAAAEMARIWRGINGGRRTAPGALGDSGRSKLKFDLQIIAVAVSRKADIIYTHDPGMQKYSSFIRIEEMPETMVQTEYPLL